MGPFWEKQKLDYFYITILNYYDPLNQGMGLPGGSYSEWQPYLIGHLGGYSVQTNRSNVWWALQKDMYNRNYLNRNRVFDQELGIPSEVGTPIWIATSASGYYQYISIPVIWRNYYNIAGYHYNKYSGELWLEPKLFDSLDHQLQDALVISPEGYATISYEMYGDSFQNQEIAFTPDQSMDVTAIYVWDLYSDSTGSIDTVLVNGIDTDYERMGSGDLAQLKLDWSGTITPAGITIRIAGDPKPIDVLDPPDNLQANALNSSQVLLSWNPVGGYILGYSVEIDIDGTFQTLGTTTDTFYFDTGLLDSTSYTYRVRSYNEQYTSDPSTEIGVTTNRGGNGQVIHALNAGGGTYTSGISGIEYIGDGTTGWVSGGSTYSVSDSILNTQDDTLYQTERYGDFSYTIPIANGSYDVVLKFAEIYQDNPGTRTFDIEIEGETIAIDLDILFRTDKYKAYDVVMPIVSTDGELNIDFISTIDNAKLSALEIRAAEGGIEDLAIPSTYFLSQNHPNPFSPTTRIEYGLPREALVSINLYNISGQKVAVLVNENQSAGYHSVDFDAVGLTSGIYFYRIAANDFSETKKMILVR
jgi:hypothetical protein